MKLLQIGTFSEILAGVTFELILSLWIFSHPKDSGPGFIMKGYYWDPNRSVMAPESTGKMVFTFNRHFFLEISGITIQTFGLISPFWIFGDFRDFGPGLSIRG